MSDKADRDPRWMDYQSLDDLKPHPANAKTHNVDLLRRGLARFGYTQPVSVDERTGLLSAGHGRRKMLLEDRAAGKPAPDGVIVRESDGAWLVPVTRGWSSANDKEAKAQLVEDNQSTIAGGWDDAGLASLLESIQTTPLGLDGIGFSDDDLKDLLASLEGPRPKPTVDPDDIPEPPADPITQPGDVWALGPHRLICGDCRSAEDVKRLLDGAQVNLAFTSPPYADRRKYDEASPFRPVPPEEYVEWFAPVAANVVEHLADDGSWFVNIRAGADGLDTELYVLDLVLAHVRRWGWHFATEFCWERLGVPKEPVLRFKNQFEAIYQFTLGRWKFRPGQVMHQSKYTLTAFGPGRGNTSWADPGSAVVSQGSKGDLFEGQRGQKGEIGWAYPGNRLPTFIGSHEATGHTAAFPVGLPAWFVRAYTDPGDTVYDPFMGSGSTLLAAHQHDRVGFGCEISPAYCDVVCARFEAFTGIPPLLADPAITR